MKKLLCTCLALLLIACPALAGAGADVNALLDQLDAYLSFNEQLFSLEAGAYQSVERFYEDRNYASLVSLRIASDQGQQLVCAMTAPEMSLTDEQLLHLMAQGVETDALEVEMQEMQQVVEMTLTNLYNIESDIDGALLCSELLENMYANAQLNRQSLELEMQYICTLLNYLLLPVANDAQVREFWASIPQRYPLLGLCRSEWEPDSDALIARAAQLLEDYGLLINQSAELVGSDSFMLDQIMQRMQQGGAEALKDSVLLVDGMPTALPLPSEWYDPLEASVIVDRYETGALPTAITLREDGVSPEAFREYVEQLIELGAKRSDAQGSDDAGWTYVLQYDGQRLELGWERDGSATISYNPECISLEWEVYLACLQ